MNTNSKKLVRRPTLTAFETVEAEVLGKFPKVRKLWDETEPRRRISMMLVGLRKKAALSQKQIAERTGWNKAFVSRLESARASIPDADTVARYAMACGARAGFVVGEQSDSTHMHILDAVTLHFDMDEKDSNPFERLRNTNVKLNKNEEIA